MDIKLLAVPAFITYVLTYVFQDLKPIIERVPGLHPNDASHDDGLRVVYATLAFVAMLVYTLYTSGYPANAGGWYTLLLQVGATAVAMAVGGHFLYQKVSSGGSSSATSAPAPTVSADPALPPGVSLASIMSDLAPETTTTNPTPSPTLAPPLAPATPSASNTATLTTASS